MALYPVDLHAHTTASDGTHTPTQLVERAARQGLRILGIADHDSLDGISEAQKAGMRLAVEVIPAVEFSIRHEQDKQFVGIHLLGYFIDVEAPSLTNVMSRVQQGRLEQKVQQIEKLQTFGFDIPVAEVFARTTGVPGRPHIATVLMERNPGRFETVQQIYDEYLGAQAKAHVGRKFALTVGQAATVIKEAGGLPVLAHPGAYQARIDPIVAIRNARAEGVEGVEVFYPYKQGHRLPQDFANNGDVDWIERTKAQAEELGLLMTGGTDFHGRPDDTVDLGDMGLTHRQFVTLKQGWQILRGKSI